MLRRRCSSPALAASGSGWDARPAVPTTRSSPRPTSGTAAEEDATTTTIGDADTEGQADPANATAEATAVPVPAPPLGRRAR